MHQATQPPELIDAWLPARVGRNARLGRLTEFIDWTPLVALVAELHAARRTHPVSHAGGRDSGGCASASCHWAVGQLWPHATPRGARGLGADPLRDADPGERKRDSGG